MSTIKAQCPRCGATTDVAYVMLGAPMECPHCGRTVVQEVPVGAPLPDTGYELSFADFRLLLRTVEGRETVGRLLGEWYGHRVVGELDQATIRSGRGRAVEPLTVHVNIQRDPVKQLALYRAAMAIWR